MQGMGIQKIPPMGPMAGMVRGGMGSGKMKMESMMGMSSMMGMPPAPEMVASAALPGFPGASHLYHVGADDFFLNHAAHITLTIQQQSTLNAIKEKAVSEKAGTQLKIDAAEQELWVLTASDQPDVAKIEAKLQEVDKLRGDQRLAFIRAVGEAAKVLTDGQRQSLLGFSPPQPAPGAGGMPGMPAAPAGGAAGGGMGHM